MAFVETAIQQSELNFTELSILVTIIIIIILTNIIIFGFEKQAINTTLLNSYTSLLKSLTQRMHVMIVSKPQ